MAAWNAALWKKRNPDYKVQEQLSFDDVAGKVNAWIPKFAQSEAVGATNRATQETKGVKALAPEHYEMLNRYNPALGRLMPSLDRAGESLALAAEVSGREIGPSRIETEMENQAYRDLQLGSKISPEEQRTAEQQARAAFASRGLLNSKPAAVAEVLNRHQFGDARQQYRRDFAGSVDTMRLNRLAQDTNRNLSISGQAQGLASLTNQIASNPLLDPYQRIYGAYSKPGGDVSSALNATNQAYSTNVNLALGAEQNRLQRDALQQEALIDYERRDLTHATGIQFPRMEGALGRTHDLTIQANDLAFERERLAAEMQMARETAAANKTAGIAGGALGALGSIGGAFIMSDERLKKNKQKIGKDPETGLNVYKYDWTERGKALGGEQQGQVGYLAQEVEKKYPLAVKQGPDGWKRVNHAALGKVKELAA